MTAARTLLLAAFMASMAIGCSAPEDQSGSSRSAASPHGTEARASTTTGPVTTVPPTPHPPSTTPSFRAAVEPIEGTIRTRMRSSWRPGCPVPLEALRLLRITYWGFDGEQHQGELVVAEAHAEDILLVFRRLHEARFAIEQIRLIDDFDGDDDRSMAANNTSGFNCRRATESARWSEHAYGRAVDINPVQNPYVTRSGRALPPAGVAHTARDPGTPGLIVPDGAVVAAFASVGWQWGEAWSAAKDYQHFSSTGR